MAWRSRAGLAVLGAGFLAAFACPAQNVDSVHLQFLRKHGVPCQSIAKLDVIPDMGDVVACEDGREWVLLWLENEVAFVRPERGELYRWEPDVHRSMPSLYAPPKQPVEICSEEPPPGATAAER